MGYPRDDHLDGADHLEETANCQQERLIFRIDRESGVHQSLRMVANVVPGGRHMPLI